MSFGSHYFFDVGLRISSINELRRIRVAFPFDSEPDAIKDLSNFVLNSEFAPLIFGRPVQINGDRLNYDGLSLGQGQISDRVIAISETTSKLEDKAGPRFSVWTLEFRDPAPANETIYVRFRLRVKKPGVLWTSKGWGYAKRGMIVDLRVADVRESNILGLGKAEADHIVSIKHLYFAFGIGCGAMFLGDLMLSYFSTIWKLIYGCSTRADH